MATVPVIISGVIYDKTLRTQRPVVLMGEMGYANLEIGGGPIFPPEAGGPPGHPAFPIWGPPGIDFPDRPGYPPVAGHPLPPIPDNPPDVPPSTPPGTVVKPPPESGGWGWVHPYGWGYFPGGTAAAPKAGRK